MESASGPYIDQELGFSFVPAPGWSVQNPPQVSSDSPTVAVVGPVVDDIPAAFTVNVKDSTSSLEENVKDLDRALQPGITAGSIQVISEALTQHKGLETYSLVVYQNFTLSEEKVQDKDLSLSPMEKNKDLIKTIDLHGFSLENANKTIDEFINRCFKTNVSKITVITGKGLRSNNTSNPYVSKDLSILKNSVPEFIKSNTDLMKKIKNIKEAKIEDGGSGAFNIFLKKSKE